ncbi:MAG: hypothetical protein ACSNEK_00770 [Parachlamydiaceae bacterium]
MSSINNNNYIDPSLYKQISTTEQGNVQDSTSIEHEDDVITTASLEDKTTTVSNQLFAAPKLPETSTSVTAATGTVIKTSAGNVSSPDRFNDVLNAASQLSSSGIIASNSQGLSISDYIKTISNAIQQLQEALREAQSMDDQTQAKFNNPFASASVKATTKATTTTSSDKAAESPKTETTVKEKTQSAEKTVADLLKEAGVSEKVGDLISVFSQLQYLMQNAKENVSGGIILGNNPEIALALQTLGIPLPTNPTSRFAGMAAQMAAQNTPPYDDPDFKALANSLPKGWEVVSKSDIKDMLNKIAGQIRKEAGNSYGILAKPLQALFGVSYFSQNSTDPKVLEMKTLLEAKKVLGKLTTISGAEAKAYASQYQHVFDVLYNTGVTRVRLTPDIIAGGWMKQDFLWWGTNGEMAFMALDRVIAEKGGASIVKENDPAIDKTGVATLAAGALIGNFTSAATNSITQLLNTQMKGTFDSSPLSGAEKKNIQQLVSVTLLTSILSSAVADKAVLKGGSAHKNLKNAITNLQLNGTAKSLMNSILGSSIAKNSFSSYEEDLLQESIKAFMISIGAMTSTADTSGVSSSKAVSALSSLKDDPGVASSATSALSFVESDVDQIENDTEEFLTFAKQIAPNADHQNASLENQEALMEMIKLLKKILNELMSGGQATQGLNNAMDKINEGMGIFEKNFNPEIQG